PYDFLFDDQDGASRTAKLFPTIADSIPLIMLQPTRFQFELDHFEKSVRLIDLKLADAGWYMCTPHHLIYHLTVTTHFDHNIKLQTTQNVQQLLLKTKLKRYNLQLEFPLLYTTTCQPCNSPKGIKKLHYGCSVKEIKGHTKNGKNPKKSRLKTNSKIKINLTIPLLKRFEQ
ncbi:unnamed protein product, partial [Didymodactylos carnosus]